ncbi:MAG TPA: type II CAAX endopeptidase family protein [Actinomycetota bacterium]|nr:type II CAAX endopeptidase family protein [Actinomycetota bacterium]
MTSEPIPPRPDGLHPVSGPSSPPVPVPEPGDGEPSRATWRPWEAIAVYLVAILLAGVATTPILGLIGDDDLATMAATAVAAIVILGVLVGWLSVLHPTWRQVMGVPRRGRWGAEIGRAIGFGLLLYPGIVFGVGLLVGVLLSLLSGEQPRAPEQVPSDLTAIGVAITIVYAIVIAPLHEELFFRGILFRGVRDRYGLGAGLIASGVGFALIHYLEGEWQDTLLLIGVMFFNGIALAWWYDRRRVIVAPIVAHMVFNVVGLTLIFTIG